MGDNEFEDEIVIRHKKEKKELQAQIQALKKSCTKGDKKKKKEVDEAIAKLETDLAKRHAEEIAQLATKQEETEQSDAANANLELAEGTLESNIIQEQNSKKSKAQRRREKKADEEKEREARIKEQEKINKSGPRNVELEEIKRALTSRDLTLHNISADGDCLYSAVSHQLHENKRERMTVSKLREMTATYLRKNRDEILPFLTDPDTGDQMTEDQFEDYCKKTEKTKLWGGQIEIRALSETLKCPIHVIQAGAPVTALGEQFKEKPLVITYHRHLYRLGEHYNSTMPIVQSE